jgi:hypothetical protein
VRINSFNPADKNYSNHRVKGLQAVRRILANERLRRPTANLFKNRLKKYLTMAAELII